MVSNTPNFENQESTAPSDVGLILRYQRICRHITLNRRLTAQQCTLIFSVKNLVIHNFTDIKQTVKPVLHCWNW